MLSIQEAQHEVMHLLHIGFDVLTERRLPRFDHLQLLEKALQMVRILQ